MVKTTKGPVAPREPIKPTPTPVESSDSTYIADLDDETWDRIVQMARSQSVTPAEVIRRAITQLYGNAPTSEGFNAR